jgi:AcrR family transcriptional regulator
MTVFQTPGGWRAERRESARAVILDAAWALVRAEGLSGLSLRDLARRAGTTTPTVYQYFASKNDIYDALFAQGAAAFEQVNGAPYLDQEPRAVLLEGFRRFIEFCTSDIPRYQLLFLRTIPGFAPTAEAYAPAVRALEETRARLIRNQITDPRHLDLWTALTTGLVDQQISNDPGGNRWTRLVEDAVDMFLAYCRGETTQSPTKQTRRHRQ